MLNKKPKTKSWCKQTAPGKKKTWVESDKVTRCPACGKRLKPKKEFCVGGEFVGYALPIHKTKPTKG